jgi:hypothetical protein
MWAFTMQRRHEREPARLNKESSSDESQDRHGFERTEIALVGMAGDPDDPGRLEVLDKLLKKYLPAIDCYLKAVFQSKFRVSDDWIADRRQEFAADKFVKGKLLRAFDREQGRFRDLLKKALYNFAYDRWRCERGQREKETEWPGSDSASKLGPYGFGDPPLVHDSDIVWARGVLEEALQKMKSECRGKDQKAVWVIFQRRMLTPLLEGAKAESLKETVAFMEKTSGEPLCRDVSDYQTTGDRKLKRHVRDVLSEYCRDAEQIEEELEDFKQILRHGGVHRHNPPTCNWRPDLGSDSQRD